MKIITTQISRADGRAQIVAKGNGRQRTVSYQHGLRHEANHAEAAGELIFALGETDNVLSRQSAWTHEVVSGVKHVWNV